jgi:hypothetical protein
VSRKKSRTGNDNQTRREFTKMLAAIAATPLIPHREYLRLPLSQTQSPPAPSPAAEALLEVVRIRYGKIITEEQMNEIKQSIDQALRAADRLKQFKLTNGDEPAFAFSADPE